MNNHMFFTHETAYEIDLKDPALYMNRELGLLEFQRRVLQEAGTRGHLSW